MEREATNVRVYMPDNTMMEYVATPAQRLRIKVEGANLKVDNGEVIDEFCGIPFKIVWKKAGTGAAW